MQWGIEFSIPAAYESELWSLPTPSTTRQLSRRDGNASLAVAYRFEYAPQSWKEWQRVASIKVQIANRLKRCEFEEYVQGDEIPTAVYSISELGKSFPAFVKFPQPQFPTAKGEAYRMLCRHAKRLCYEELLHVEQLIATSFRFNEIEGNGEGIGQTVRRAISAYKFAQEHRQEWPVKLTDSERKNALSNAGKKGAAIAAGKKRNNPKRTEAETLRDQGKTYAEISEDLGVSHSTVKRWFRASKGH